MRNTNKGFSTATVSAIVFAAGLSVLSASASAASACKGLDEETCGSQSSCSWVGGYERKDGRTVKAFCRTKSGAKKVTQTKTATPAKNKVSG